MTNVTNARTHKTAQPYFFKLYSILRTSGISREIHSDMKQSINLSFPNMTAGYRKKRKALKIYNIICPCIVKKGCLLHVYFLMFFDRAS